MKIALLHNPDAGIGELTVDELTLLFQAAGHEVLAASTKEQHWERALTEPVERVVIAGGDGTVSVVAPHLAVRHLPFCILPLGTANNIARSLAQVHPAKDIVVQLSAARLKKLDLGLAESCSNQWSFIEAAGFGVLVELMGRMSIGKENGEPPPEEMPDEKLMRALGHLGSISEQYPGTICEVVMDDDIISGRFLLVEAMNMSFIGPNLQLAPEANPGDGWLELMCVRDDEREAWLTYIERLKQGGQVIAPFGTRRCRQQVCQSESC
jgi:diacylglycerol kinase (ATP)